MRPFSLRRLVAALAALPLLALLAGSSAPPPAGRDAALLAHSFRRPERDGWIYVHLEGAPEQLGFQNGYWLAPEIHHALEGLKISMPRGTGKSWAWLHAAALNMLLPHIEAQYREELEGIVAGLRARGVPADLGDVIVLNAFQELPEYYVPWYDKHHPGPKTAALAAQHSPKAAPPPRLLPQGNCSAFVATGSYTRDHGIVMGHNTWTSYFPGENWNVIYDIAPKSGHRMLMDGFPGVITSDDDFGVNNAGLMITETTITQFQGWNPDGVPEFVRSRKAMQYAGSIDQWIAIMLRDNNGGYANDWLLGDRKTNEIARVELGLIHHRVWRTKDGMYVGSNFPSDPALMRDEAPSFNPRDMTSSPNARHVRWDQLRRQYKGQIDIAIAEKMESDHYDTVLRRVNPDERTLCGHADLSPRGVPQWGWGPYHPGGTVSAKVTDSALAGKMEIIAAMGHPCGMNFDAAEFLKAHPQYDWERPILKAMPGRPWTEFAAARGE